uniref:Uncharacterized protein n=1 Tax=Anguilla anguilla TaxID=7936 RepID=A0A0E9XA83_ANGAN
MERFKIHTLPPGSNSRNSKASVCYYSALPCPAIEPEDMRSPNSLSKANKYREISNTQARSRQGHTL